MLSTLGPDVAAQVEPPLLWSFTASGPVERAVPAGLPDGSVVVLLPERVNALGVVQAPPRLQKITSDGQLAWERDFTWPGIGWPVVLEDGSVLAAEGAPAFGVGRLHCHGPDGTLRWSLEPGGSPVIPPSVRPDGRIMLVITTGELLRISADGAVEGRQTLGQVVFGPGATAADGQFLLPAGSALLSLSGSGATNWVVSHSSPYGNAPAVAADGTVVMTTPTGMVLLINPDGSLRHQDWPGLALLPPVVGPDGTVYVPRTDARLEVRTRAGLVVRTIELPAPVADAPALAANGWLWLTLTDGQLVAYDAAGNLSARRAGDTAGGGSPLLRADGTLVAGFSGRQVRTFSDAGPPMPAAWPLLGGGPARTGLQAPMTVPAAPAQLSMTETNGAPALTWQPPAGLVTHAVWRAGTSNLAAATLQADFLLEPGWTDASTVAGHEYWYWVRARNAAGLGAFSPAVALRRELPSPGGLLAQLKLSDGPLSPAAQGPDGTLYVGDDAGGLFAVAADGTRRWRLDTGAGAAVGAPLVGPGGRLYFTALGGAGGVFAASPEGAVLWQIHYLQNGSVPPTPALDGDGNVRVSGAREEQDWLLTVSPDGTILRTNWLGNTGGGFSSPVLADDDSTWLGSHWSLTRYAGDGTMLWSVFEQNISRHWPLALDDAGEVLSGAAASSRGLGRFRSDGTILGSTGTNGVTGGAVVGADGTAYFGDLSGKFYALARDGSVRWSLDTGAPVSCLPALGDPGLVYVANEAGRLRALGTATGEERWLLELETRPIGGLVILEPPALAVTTTNGVLHLIRLAGAAADDAPWPMLGRNAAHHGRLPTTLPALTAPTGLGATEAATNAEVTVAWQPVPGAAWYEVHRAPTSDLAAAIPLATNLTRATAFADLDAPTDRPLWYWVRGATPAGPGPWGGPARGGQGSRRWRVPLPAGAFAAPAVAADGTVLTLQPGPQRQAVLMALAAADGAELWRRDVGGPVGFITPPPPVLAEDGRIFASGSNVMRAFSASGDVQWEAQGRDSRAIGSMALTQAGLLVYPVGNSLIARRISDGLKIWDLAFSVGERLGPVIAADGTIWVCRSPGSVVALRPDGSQKFQVPVSAYHQPVLSLGGDLFVADASQRGRFVTAAGTVVSLESAVRTFSPGLGLASNVFAIATSVRPTEILLATSSTQVLARLPGGWPAGAYVDLAAGADGTWYAADLQSVRVLGADGAPRAVWSLADKLVEGMVLGDDGTLVVAERNHISAFRGSGPPDASAWAMLRKDRRNSASWEVPAAPDLPAGLTALPLPALNRAALQWQRPTNLAVIEVWRSVTTNIAEAVLVGGPFTSRTNFNDYSRQPGTTAHYWLRVLDVGGMETGVVGPVASTTADGATIAWEIPLAAEAQMPALADDGTLYMDLRGLTAFRPDGTLAWVQTNAAGYLQYPPVVGPDGRIFLASGTDLSAVEPDGRIAWQASLQSAVGGIELALSEAGQLVAAGSFGLRAFGLDGQPRWWVDDGTHNGVTLAADGTIYATTWNRYLRCFSPDGELRWTAATPAVFQRGGTVAENGEAVVPGSDGRLRRLDAAGSLRWEQALDATPSDVVLTSDGFAAAAGFAKIALLTLAGEIRTNLSLPSGPLTAAADGTLLVAARGSVLALDGDGALRWSWDLPAANIQPTPVLLSADGRIYFGAASNLFALDSTLRPAATGWNTARANPRRTGQWLPPADDRPLFNGWARQPDGGLDLNVTIKAAGVYALQQTTNWPGWETVHALALSRGTTNLHLPSHLVGPAGFIRLLRQTAP